ncbi:MAG: RNA methyltransferase [Oscillospiraceae bacterium]|nr:RNA methyltransferase [Oscillospiraceae bacterium]
MKKEIITSRKNPLLQLTRKLLSSRSARQKEGLFAADGTKLLEEAIRFYPGLDTVILSEGVEVPELPDHVRLVEVPRDVMASISPMEAPQGALFLCKLPKPQPFAPQPGMLILDGIQDPGNVGTILRTADALDVSVVLLEGCADPWNWKTVRSSMGAVFRTPVLHSDWETVRTACKAAGIPIGVTALSDRAVDIRGADLGTMALVIGSEGQGVRKEILESADAELIIPMNPHCESLNAAIAAAIVMWQIRAAR